MIVSVADTHTVLWFLFSDSQLGPSASASIDAAMASGDHEGVSAISLAEIVYLIEKERIALSALDDTLAAVADPRSVLQQVLVDSSGRIPLSTIKTIW